MIGRDPPDHGRHQRGRRHDRRHFVAPAPTHSTPHLHASGAITAKPQNSPTKPQGLTTDQLNDLSANHVFSDEKNAGAYFASRGQTTTASGASSEPFAQYTPPLNEKPISIATLRVQAATEMAAPDEKNLGRVEYKFEVGSDHVPHIYTGTLQADGTLKSQVYEVVRNQRVPAHIPEAEVAALAKYARMDIAQARTQDPDHVVNLSSNLSSDRIKHVSEALATSMLELAHIKKDREGAAKVQKYLNENPDMALSLIRNHGQNVREMLAANPYLDDVIKQYRAAHPGTDLSNELGKFDKGSQSETALNNRSPFSKPPTNPNL